MSCGMTDRRGQPTDEELKSQVRAEVLKLGKAVSEANTRQVGGEHYKSPLQHWDFITDHGYSYLIGCATKYPMRWRQKNGAQDIEKSIHFAEKALENPVLSLRTWKNATKETVAKFCDANNLGQLETAIVSNLLLCHQGDGRTRVEHAITLLGILLGQAREWEQLEARRSQLGLPRERTTAQRPNDTVRGFDPQQDARPARHLCATVGGEDREVRVGDQVIVKSHLPVINGGAGRVTEVDGVWVKLVFDHDGRTWTDQHVNLTIIEKNV